MTVSNGDVVRITAKLSYQNVDDMLNVYHVVAEMTTPLDDEAFMTALAADIDASYQLIADHQSDKCKYDTIEFYHVTDDYPMGEREWPTLDTGAETTAQALPTQVAAQVNFPTGVKKSQGRKYIGGFHEGASTSGGSLDATAKSDLEDFGAQFIGGVSITGGTVYFGHYDSTGTNFRTWTSVVVPALMSTQRRRKQGVGA